jgi:hypothetical protein
MITFTFKTEIADFLATDETERRSKRVLLTIQSRSKLNVYNTKLHILYSSNQF